MTELTWDLLQRRLIERYATFKIELTQRLGSADLAGDALQDTWLRLKRGGELDSIRSVDGYLLCIARNFGFQELRNKHRRLTVSEASLMLDLIDESPGPERAVESSIELKVLKQIMAGLSPRRRAILMAARVEDRSRAEIAAEYRISRRVVQAELQAAQEYCAARLQKLNE